MIAGGGILNTFRKQDPAGAPFTSTSAENGVSIDTATGRVVLGDDGNAPNAGQFLSDRFLSTMGFLFEMFGNLGAIDFLEALVHLMGDGAAGAIAELRMEDNAQPQHLASIRFDHVNGQLIIEYANGVPQMSAIQVRAGGVNISNPSGSAPVTTALLEVTDGGVATQQPSANGPGVWRLGTVQNAAVALDGTRYVEVSIGGVVVRLGIVV